MTPILVMIVGLSMMLADSGIKRSGPAKQWLVFKDMLIPVVCVAYNGETVCSTPGTTAFLCIHAIVC